MKFITHSPLILIATLATVLITFAPAEAASKEDKSQRDMDRETLFCSQVFKNLQFKLAVDDGRPNYSARKTLVDQNVEYWGGKSFNAINRLSSKDYKKVNKKVRKKGMVNSEIQNCNKKRIQQNFDGFMSVVDPTGEMARGAKRVADMSSPEKASANKIAYCHAYSQKLVEFHKGYVAGYNKDPSRLILKKAKSWEDAYKALPKSEKVTHGETQKAKALQDYRMHSDQKTVGKDCIPGYFQFQSRVVNINDIMAKIKQKRAVDEAAKGTQTEIPE